MQEYKVELAAAVEERLENLCGDNLTQPVCSPPKEGVLSADALEAVRPVWWGAEDKPEHKECHKVSAHRGVSGADVAWGASGKKIGE